MNDVEKAKNLLLGRSCNNCIYQTFHGKPMVMRCLLDEPPYYIRESENELCDEYCNDAINENVNFHVQTQFLKIVNMQDLEYFKGFVEQYKNG